MALCIGSSSSSSTSTHLLSIRSDANPKTPRMLFSLPLGRRASESHVARARRVSPRSKKSNLTTTPQKESEQQLKAPPFPEDAASSVDVVDGFVMPDLPGDKPDFWEGPQWNAFGVFVQYMWAFGIGFAVFFFPCSPYFLSC
ncbi:hypothetical protein ACLOJK_034555 [Asimina triloba]